MRPETRTGLARTGLVIVALTQPALIFGGLPQTADATGSPQAIAGSQTTDATGSPHTGAGRQGLWSARGVEHPSAALRLWSASSRAGMGQRVILSLIPRRQVTAGVLDEALRIVDRRLTSLGLEGWRTTFENGAIAIHLPAGVTSSTVKRTAAAVSQAGYLFFRPVDCEIAPYRTPAPGPRMEGSKAAKAACHAGVEAQERLATTPPIDDAPTATVVLRQLGAPTRSARYVLGPAEMNGTVVKSAAADKQAGKGQWEVNLHFTLAGEKLINRYARAHYRCYEKDPAHPPTCALQAVELDGVVQEAAYVQAPSFPNGATINASFSAAQAKGLARALEYGALPVRFKWALETLTKEGSGVPRGARLA